VLSAPIDAAERGTYVVVWQVFAADTHPSRGTFPFSVGETSSNPYSQLLGGGEAGTATPLGLALQALAHALHFAGFALAFGVAAYGVLAARPQPLGRLIGVGVGLLIVAEPVAFAAQLASLSFDSDTALAVLGSTFGRLLGLRLAAALAAWSLLATGRSWPLLAAGAADAVLDGLGAHAIEWLPLAGQLLVAAHVSAMGAWTGGLVAYLRAPDRRFARYAALTFGAAVVSGLLLGAVHTKLGTALLTTPYGQVLALKMLAVAAAVVLALTRRHRAEAVVAAGAVIAATVVAALPPPA
jgi:copper transport protein